MKFVDEAIIEVKAGDGGAGSRHFRREKFVPFGGPDGGNGGNGGSVTLVADPNKHTLLDFKYQPIWKAENGNPGAGSLKDGKRGEDLIILVPVGTQAYLADSEEPLCDLTSEGERFTIAKGGRGGKGNSFFKSPTNQAPEHAQPGEEGEEGAFRLSLKLVADVGLIGFPNAGKSTLISRISAAKPKIADYPFTTLTPNLGVARTKGGRNFVVADIPGLIPGAHEGKGLGAQFLKHVERTRVLAHLIDPYQLNDDGELLGIENSFETINNELNNFSELLAGKEQVVVITKMDAITDEKELDKAMTKFRDQGLEVHAISSVSGQGIDELKEALAAKCLVADRVETGD